MEEILTKKGIRATKARIDILKLLEHSDPLTADEIFEKLQSNGAKLSSIYRNLSILTEKNILTKINGIDNFSYFQLNDHEHKHHLTCKECKKTIALDNCPIGHLESEIEEKTDFIITNHIFEFIGICPDCQKKDKK